MEPISSQLEPGRSVTLAIQFVPKTALNYACKLVGVPDHFPVQYPMDSNDPSCLNPQPGQLWGERGSRGGLPIDKPPLLGSLPPRQFCSLHAGP